MDSQYPDERTHKQVIVIRKDLKMRQGKAVAQGSHASMAAVLARATITDGELRIPLDADIGPWLQGRFTKVCVHVPDEAALLDVHNRARQAGLPYALIQDAGLTEFGGVPTYTAVAVGPGLNDEVNRITGGLPLL
ncbi:aminoacyl-tRNA hydrolase [Paraburkholderia sp. A3RO-2L]|jgi:PTH2 family peptidyl-tRNA hydrolase|uniref:aminoacyl-tRNA hydrolase n=1 Tax=Paraburkholderia sp. A3RO-2L TaxID=3028376 RepID=UPI003DA88A4A